MSPAVRNQLLIYGLLIPILAYVTIAEWKKIGFLNFTDAASDAKVEEFAKSFPKSPTNVGDWVMIEEQTPINPEQIKAANIKNFYNVTYRNTRTKSVLTAFLSTGPKRDLCIHTPDACFPGAGLKAMGEESTREITAGATEGNKNKKLGSFLSQQFAPPGQPAAVEVWWAFNAKHIWIGEKSPRTSSEFSDSPAMYKLYLVQDLRNKGGLATESVPAQQDFLEHFIPMMNKELFAHERPKSANSTPDEKTESTSVSQKSVN